MMILLERLARMCRFGNTLQNSKQAKDEGLKIKVKSFTDPVALKPGDC